MSIYPPLTLAQNAGYEVKGVVVDIGSMENKGVEFNLNFIPVQTKDWNLTVGFNGCLLYTSDAADD